MAFPEPVPGLVIRYSYLWWREYERGQEEGAKDRPCAVVTSVANFQGNKAVTVLPVTHVPPSDPASAVEIPHLTKQRLSLDDDRCWVVLTEANRFVWPGPDIRMRESGDPASVAYGLLPRSLAREIIKKFGDVVEARINRTVPRTE